MSRVCIVYGPGEDVVELGDGGLVRRKLDDYEVWVGDCINPGTHVASSSSKAWAERIGLGLAMSMGLRFMGPTTDGNGNDTKGTDK